MHGGHICQRAFHCIYTADGPKGGVTECCLSCNGKKFLLEVFVIGRLIDNRSFTICKHIHTCLSIYTFHDKERFNKIQSLSAKDSICLQLQMLVFIKSNKERFFDGSRLKICTFKYNDKVLNLKKTFVNIDTYFDAIPLCFQMGHWCKDLHKNVNCDVAFETETERDRKWGIYDIP